MGVFSQKINYRFKYFPNTVNSEQELFKTQVITFEKKIQKKCASITIAKTD